jgi:hypothetical protein
MRNIKKSKKPTTAPKPRGVNANRKAIQKNINASEVDAVVENRYRVTRRKERSANDGSRQLCAEKIDPGYFDKK